VKLSRTVMIVTALVLLFAPTTQVLGQQETQSAAMKLRVLLVDETKTFLSTMRVGALAGVLKGTGMVDVDVKMVDVDSSYADPLGAFSVPELPYDLILIVPAGIDDATVAQIWLVTRYFDKTTPQYAILAGFSGIVDQVFQGAAVAVDVSEDLWPAGYASLYLAEGWLR